MKDPIIYRDIHRITYKNTFQNGLFSEPIQIHRNQNNGVEYLTFPLLSEIAEIDHLFSTRIGGRSSGIWSTMNLGFSNGDDPNLVKENYQIMASCFGKDKSDLVLSQQTHTTNIRRVTCEDKGKGVTRELDYKDVDGLFTNEAGIILATSYADCVPLYFVDKEKKIIGLAHSGWKGTAGMIGLQMVRRLQEEFSCRPEELITAIGPSICQSCYEVSSDVAEVFLKLTKDCLQPFILELYQRGYASEYSELTAVAPGLEAGKYQLDLWAINYAILRLAGVLAEHIAIPDICTCHNPEYLFSHRASKGKRGNLNAMLMIKN